MIDNLSIAAHAFATLKSLSVDEIFISMYELVF